MDQPTEKLLKPQTHQDVPFYKAGLTQNDTNPNKTQKSTRVGVFKPCFLQGPCYIPASKSLGRSVSRPDWSSSDAHGRATAFCRCNTSLSFSTCHSVTTAFQHHSSHLTLKMSISYQQLSLQHTLIIRLLYSAAHFRHRGSLWLLY